MFQTDGGQTINDYPTYSSLAQCFRFWFDILTIRRGGRWGMEIHKIEESIAYKKKPNAERATIMWNGRICFNNTAQLLGTIEIHRRLFDVIIRRFPCTILLSPLLHCSAIFDIIRLCDFFPSFFHRWTEKPPPFQLEFEAARFTRARNLFLLCFLFFIAFVLWWNLSRQLSRESSQWYWCIESQEWSRKVLFRRLVIGIFFYVTAPKSGIINFHNRRK